ncbi:hypothetical protein [Thiofilum flexile]|uniref:hypothetical protein n=1 Tax=Thiofilum flexile TaxID=125627 RepID=UPI000382458A|nr:hypothetical protein [Thiofilum flexile]
MYTPTQDLRRQIAEEAARLIYDEGYRDYRIAKTKAAQRFGQQQSYLQPTNEEVEQALQDHIRLFESETQPAILRHHREIALEAMDFLQAFHPVLVGAALEGTSGPLSAVTLQLRANAPEEVMMHLDDHQIPFQTQERRLNYGKRQDYYPLFRLYVDNIEVELLVIPDDPRFANAALSPITGKGIRRAEPQKVRELLAEME